MLNQCSMLFIFLKIFKSDPLLDKGTISAFRFRDIPLRSRVFVSWEKSCCRVRISVPDCQLKLLFSFYTRTWDSVSPSFSLTKLTDRSTNEMLQLVNVNQVSANQMVVLMTRCIDCLFRLRSCYLAVRTRKMENTMAEGKSQFFSSFFPIRLVEFISNILETSRWTRCRVFLVSISEVQSSDWRIWLIPKQRYSWS